MQINQVKVLKRMKLLMDVACVHYYAGLLTSLLPFLKLVILTQYSLFFAILEHLPDVFGLQNVCIYVDLIIQTSDLPPKSPC